MLYRKEIDGLRAICILPVIFYHFDLPYFNGGYIGVDIFFVISGYLICSLVIKDINEKRFSLKNFYERRARRILPLLFLVIIVTTLISKILYSPDYFESIIESSLSSTFLFSNFYFWKQSGYFEVGSELNPLFHTWSLSIEEQFYILFPILFIFFLGFLRKKIIFLIALIIITGLVISYYTSRYHPSANFYLLPFRTFEICFGILSALIYNFYDLKKINKHYKNYLSLFGFLFIIFSIFLFNEDTLSPGVVSLFPILGCSLVILFCEKSTFIYKFLSNKILVLVGLISYGLYLWHIPILNFYKINFSLNSTNDYFYLFFFTFLTALVTWKFIEKPFRNFKKISSKIFLIILFSYTIIYLILIFYLNFNLQNKRENFVSTLNDKQKLIYKQTKIANLDNGYHQMYDDGKCKFWSRRIDENFRIRFDECFNNKKSKALFLFGDSHQMDLYNGIANQISNKDFIVSVSRGRCRLHTPRPLGYGGCEFDKIKNFIHNHKDMIDAVIYHQSGSFFLRGGKSLPVKNKDIIKVKKYLEELNFSNIIWVGPRIEPNILMDYTYTKNFIKHNSFVNNNIKFVDKDILKSLKQSSIRYVSITDIVDFNLMSDFFVNNKFTFSDYAHWSKFGEFYFTNIILDNSNVFKSIINKY